MNAPLPTIDQIEQAFYEAQQRYTPTDEADVSAFSLAAVTVEGESVLLGDSDEIFPLGAMAKVFNLALAMEHCGAATLREKLGLTAAAHGETIPSALELYHQKNISPLLLAGALATVSLIPGENDWQRWDSIQSHLNSLARAALPVMEDRYSEQGMVAQRARGLAWLLESEGYFYADVETSVNIFLRMSSLGVTAPQLALMGATLAHWGRSPLSPHQQLIAEEHVHRILTDMIMDGLYGGSGHWLYEVGLPAKSSRSGGIVCIVPGVMALAAYSPPLDEHGNSRRAKEALALIVNQLELNPLRCYTGSA